VVRVADDVQVRRITTLLEPAGRVEGNPVRLTKNEGIAFQGCIVLGMGFVLDVAEAQEWIATDPRNADVLFPYLNGEDLNSRPDASASRWVIDFTDRAEAEAAKFEMPFGRLLDRVKSERTKNNRKVYRDYWWQYAEKRPAMRKAISGLPEVLVIALVSKTVMPMRVRAGQVFSHKLAAFATDSYSTQAVLSSSIHVMWAIKYSSTMRADINYSPSDVFETFPRPPDSPALDGIGRELDETRRKIMLRRDLGLTKLYNLVNDPVIQGDREIERMRDIHVEIDEATMAAYGWDDVALDHGFHSYRQVQRWTIAPAARAESLDRLLLENHRRARDGG